MQKIPFTVLSFEYFDVCYLEFGNAIFRLRGNYCFTIKAGRESYDGILNVSTSYFLVFQSIADIFQWCKSSTRLVDLGKFRIWNVWV